MQVETPAAPRQDCALRGSNPRRRALWQRAAFKFAHTHHGRALELGESAAQEIMSGRPEEGEWVHDTATGNQAQVVRIVARRCVALCRFAAHTQASPPRRQIGLSALTARTIAHRPPNRARICFADGKAVWRSADALVRGEGIVAQPMSCVQE